MVGFRLFLGQFERIANSKNNSANKLCYTVSNLKKMAVESWKLKPLAWFETKRALRLLLGWFSKISLQMTRRLKYVTIENEGKIYQSCCIISQCTKAWCVYTLDYFLDMKNDVYGGMRFTLIVPLYFPYILFSASHLICPISILGYDSTTYKMVWASATTEY